MMMMVVMMMMVIIIMIVMIMMVPDEHDGDGDSKVYAELRSIVKYFLHEVL